MDDDDDLLLGELLPVEVAEALAELAVALNAISLKHRVCKICLAVELADLLEDAAEDGRLEHGGAATEH